MNFLLVLAVVTALSGLSLGEHKKPGYCYKEFPPTGEPDVVEVKKMNKLIEVLRRDALKKFDDYKEEIENLKTQIQDEKIKHRDLEGQNENLKSQNADMMNQIKLIEENCGHVYKLVNEEKNSKTVLEEELNQKIIENKNEISKLKATIEELNQSVNVEKNSKGKLQKEYFELKYRIQELFQNGTEDIFDATTKGSLSAVKYWYAIDPSSIYRDYKPLYSASAYGYLSIVEFLLSKGVDTDAGDSFYTTPLMRASINGDVPVAQALLDKGAKINHQNKYKWTALHCAVTNDHLPLVKVLIERGADKSIKDGGNKSPLDWAKEQGKKSIEDYLSSL